MNVQHKIEYNERLEELIAEEGEKALCYSWMHSKAEALYSYRNNFIALPVIVLSTLAGTASIGSDSLFGDSPFASVGIGLVSITVGVLNTIGQYFSWAKRAEGHRIAYIMYQKLYKFISVEMSLPRRERMSATDLLKVVREEVDRLAETSPSLPSNIILQFQNNFKKYTDVARPEITNGLEKIYIFQEQFDNEGKLIPKLKQNSAANSLNALNGPNGLGATMNGALNGALNAISSTPSMVSLPAAVSPSTIGLESFGIKAASIKKVMTDLENNTENTVLQFTNPLITQKTETDEERT